MSGFWSRFVKFKVRNEELEGLKNTSLGRRAEIEVLAQFVKGADPKRAVPEAWRGFWRGKLGVDFEQAAIDLHARGLLRDASLAEKLSAANKVSDLKTIAKRLGLKVSGTKANLAKRIAEEADSSLIAQHQNATLWTCSETALERVKQHRADEEASLQSAIGQTWELLGSDKLREAAMVACAFKDAQFYPQGLNVDWKTADRRIAKELEVVMGAEPRFHVQRFGGVSRQVHLCAAMETLWGRDGVKFARGGLDVGAEEIELPSRMLMFHARHVEEVARLSEVKLPRTDWRYEIVVVEDANTTCEACLNERGKLYDLADVPELPHEYCQCKLGCRCNLVMRQKGL